jgi:photosystem II stability/assembly factor-like uncharacterized protein
MYRYLLTSLFVLILAFSHSNSHAQWEQIGWNGQRINVEAQIDRTLYATKTCGIYRSDDLGKSWQLIRDSLPINNITMLHPWITFDEKHVMLHQPQELLRDDFKKGVFFYENSADHWKFIRADSLPFSKPITYDNKIISKDTVYFYFNRYHGNGDTSGFFISTDGGMSYTKKELNLIASVPDPGIEVEHKGRTLFLRYSGRDTILKEDIHAEFTSTDLGETWKRISLPMIQTTEHTIYWMSDSLVFLQTKSQGDTTFSLLYLSNDQGSTWTLMDGLFPTDRNWWEVSCIRERNRNIYVSFATSTTKPGHLDYHLVQTFDQGKSWHRIQLDTNFGIWDIFGYDNVFFVTTKYGMLKTDSSFHSFQKLWVNTQYGGNRTLYHVSGTSIFTTLGIESLDNYNDSLYKSTDNGESWNAAPFVQNYNLYPIRWIENSKFIFALASDSNNKGITVFRSSDKGNSWENVATFFPKKECTPKLFGLDTIFLNPRIYGERDSIILYSIDNGVSWETLLPPPLKNTQDLAISYCNSTLWSFGESPDSGIYFSRDLGHNWTSISTPSLEVTKSFYTYKGNLFLSTDELVQGGTGDMIVSSDQGVTWKYCKGLPSNATLLPSLAEHGKLYLIASSTNKDLGNSDGGNSLYTSGDDGSSWIKVPGNSMEASNIAIGSEYIFIYGDYELWRIPKSLVSVHRSITQAVRSIFTYPNPASDQMQIRFTLEKPGDVTIMIFDMMGRTVSMPVDKTMDAGEHEVLWDTRSIPSGSYLIELKSNGSSNTKVVTILR